MGRKVFISILGTGFYEKCNYQSNDFTSAEVRFVQEAILENIGAREWKGDDVALILLTKKARTDNWNKEIKYRKRYGVEGDIEYEALEARIEKMQLPIQIQTPDIPDGKNDTEMWDIFKILFELINDNDELYFDLTHSFRYLPMLLLVFSNYVKFLKKTKVAHISYGNYDARDKENNIAPIISLLPISALQDWTFASANYLENGNVKRLIELCNNELKPILVETKGRDEKTKNLKSFINALDKVVEERVNCRGISIVNAENMKVLKQASVKIPNTFIEPLNHIFDKIKNTLSEFDENENVQNGFAAVKWCLDFGLYQQATTILNENIVTFVCMKTGLNWKQEHERLLVNTAFYAKENNIEDKDLKVSNKKIEKDERERLVLKVKEIMNTYEVEKLYYLFSCVADLRNDFNHAGMRDNPMSAEKLKIKIQEKFKKIQEIIVSC